MGSFEVPQTMIDELQGVKEDLNPNDSAEEQKEKPKYTDLKTK